MGDTRVEARHDREMFDPSLIPLECFDGGEVSDHNEGPGNPALVVVQDRSGKDHMQDVPARMVDGYLYLPRMPAPTDCED